jgi:hypothetical protein
MGRLILFGALPFSLLGVGSSWHIRQEEVCSAGGELLSEGGC